MDLMGKGTGGCVPFLCEEVWWSPQWGAVRGKGGTVPRHCGVHPLHLLLACAQGILAALHDGTESCCTLRCCSQLVPKHGLGMRPREPTGTLVWSNEVWSDLARHLLAPAALCLQVLWGQVRGCGAGLRVAHKCSSVSIRRCDISVQVEVSEKDAGAATGTAGVTQALCRTRCSDVRRYGGRSGCDGGCEVELVRRGTRHGTAVLPRRYNMRSLYCTVCVERLMYAGTEQEVMP